MNWEDLRLFVTAASADSQRDAARILGIDQSTLSRRLARLEETVGGPLFARGPGGTSLTERGARLLGPAEAMTRAAEDAARAVASTEASLTGTLRVAAPTGLARTLVPELIAGFCRAHPGVTVDLHTGDRPLDLRRLEADVSLRITHAPHPELRGRRIARIATARFATRAVAACPPDERPALGYVHEGSSPGQAWRRRLAAEGAVHLRVTSPLELVAAARAGLGVARLPVYLAHRVDELVPLGPPETEDTMHLWLLTHPDLADTPRVRAFLDYAGPKLTALKARLEGSELRA